MHLHASIKERQREFKDKLLQKAKNDDEYGCIKLITPYINVRTPIEFKCLKCGLVFKRNPVSVFKNKTGICPNHIRSVLSKINITRQKKRYHKELVAKEKQTGEYGKIKQLTPYKNWTSEIKFKCLNCGLVFKRKPSSIYGCSYICCHKAYVDKCNKSHEAQGFTLKQVKTLVSDRVSPDYKVLSKRYINNRTKLTFEHHSIQCIYYQRRHKFYRFEMSLGSFLEGHHCPKDGRFQSHLKFKKTTEQFKQEVLKQRKGEYLVRSKYISNRHHVLIEHHSKRCVYYQKYHQYYQWWTLPGSITRFNSMCPKDRVARIAEYHRKSLSDVKRKVYKLVGNEFIVLSKYYVGEHVKLRMIHKSKQCPYYQKYHRYYKFNVSTDYFYSNLRCPYDNISCGEKAIIAWLNRHNLKRFQDYYYAYILKHHKYTKGRQHLDFYLPNVKYDDYYINGIGIEFDGVQHFKMVNFGYSHNNGDILKACNNLIDNMLRDQIKNEYCYHHRIKLIRIRNNRDYVGKRLRQLVNITLNQQLLSTLQHIRNKQLALF